MKYVIIGNSAAAIGGVEGIRSRDKTGGITLVSDESHFTYSRPLISYLLEGKTDRERMLYRGRDFYEKNGVTALLGRRAERLEDHAVVLDSGERLPFDRLLVATGSSPIVPPVPGLTDYYTFMTLDEALRLEAALTKESRVLIVGAGLIGLKCLEGIAARVGEVTVADRAPQILPSVLDAEAAARMQAHIESASGAKFLLGDSLARVEGHTAHLESGREAEFDILVLAVGVRPNTAFVREAGGEVRRGIVAGDGGRTSLADVYAAGDCRESRDVTTGQERVLALLPNAYMQGHSAGVNMAGGSEVFDKAIAMNALGLFGLHAITAGSYIGTPREHVDANQYKKLFVQDGRLKGYILLGDVERAGIYTALIREQTPLSQVDFDLIFEKPQLMAFSRSERVRRMGGLPQ